MTVYAIDPPDIADREQEQDDTEDVRAARWAEFIAWARQASIPVLLDDVSKLMRGQTDPWYAHRGVDERLSTFAETEQWSGVLRALGRVLEESGQ